MNRIPYGRYTPEFREEAVKLVTEGGLSSPEAAHPLKKFRSLTDVNRQSLFGFAASRFVKDMLADFETVLIYSLDQLGTAFR